MTPEQPEVEEVPAAEPVADEPAVTGEQTAGEQIAPEPAVGEPAAGDVPDHPRSFVSPERANEAAFGGGDIQAGEHSGTVEIRDEAAEHAAANEEAERIAFSEQAEAEPELHEPETLDTGEGSDNVNAGRLVGGTEGPHAGDSNLGGVENVGNAHNPEGVGPEPDTTDVRSAAAEEAGEPEQSQ